MEIISPETGPVIIYDSLGNKLEEWYVVNGQMDGEHKTYTTQGTLISKITYKNGKKMVYMSYIMVMVKKL